MKSRCSNTFIFAFKGIKTACKERNLKIHLCITALVIIAGFVLKISAIEWCLVLLCISSVISLEIINTAIEEIVDFISPEHNKKAGKIKDLSAGAVLISACISVIIGCIIFIPKTIHLLGI